MADLLEYRQSWSEVSVLIILRCLFSAFIHYVCQSRPKHDVLYAILVSPCIYPDALLSPGYQVRNVKQHCSRQYLVVIFRAEALRQGDAKAAHPPPPLSWAEMVLLERTNSADKM